MRLQSSASWVRLFQAPAQLACIPIELLDRTPSHVVTTQLVTLDYVRIMKISFLPDTSDTLFYTRPSIPISLVSDLTTKPICFNLNYSFPATTMSIEAAAAILFGILQLSISLITLWQQHRLRQDRQCTFYKETDYA